MSSWCMSHWNQLRKAIDDRGLSHLVGTEESIARGTWDPLLAAYMEISQRVMDSAGPIAINNCPCCLLANTSPKIADNWINGASNDVRVEALAKRLVEPAPIIKVLYTCDKCGLKDVDIYMEEIRDNEEIVAFVERVGALVSLDHEVKKPDCRITTITNVKIPMGNKEFLGKADK